MRAIITVIGKDSIGIIASISQLCLEAGVNILNTEQTIVEEYFTMVMLVDISNISIDFADFQQIIQNSNANLVIRVMHEEQFNVTRPN